MMMIINHLSFFTFYFLSNILSNKISIFLTFVNSFWDKIIKFKAKRRKETEIKSIISKSTHTHTRILHALTFSFFKTYRYTGMFWMKMMD